MSQIFASKARTLEALAERITTASVLPLVRFSVTRWRDERNAVLDEIACCLGTGPYIVRSSAAAEDALHQSLAGHFESLGNVSGARNALASAIDRVVISYGDGDSSADEVLVQPFLQTVELSGVAFSHDPNSGAPYRVINYHRGNDTAAVTAGSDHDLHTHVHAQGSPLLAPAELRPILALIDELERITAAVPLDVEFAIARGRLFLLQVRPLIVKAPLLSMENHAVRIGHVADKIAQGMKPHPFLHGKTTAYGVMPDWNPAEIIGLRPRPLALSVYRELVTDATWAYQRHNYGYKNLRSFPLLVSFHGLPYIDTRVSFNSFLPRDIDGDLADRLVDYYIGKLLASPSLHDKVEFEIVFSCYSLDLPDRLATLGEHGFTEAEQKHLSDSLRNLTNRIIDPKTGLWRADRDKLTILTDRRQRILESRLDPIGRIYWLLEDCKRYGTLPFAGLARAGFIAVQILRSLVAIGVFSHADYDAFMASLNTVSGQLARDRHQLSRDAFIEKYGHLRPGTYDILSRRYDAAADFYFDWQNDPGQLSGGDEGRDFSLTLPQMREITRLLEAHGIAHDVVGLFDFLQAGVELREYSKFLFTRNLSDALALIDQCGGEFGFTTEEMSFVDIRYFYQLHGNSVDAKALLRRAVAEGREHYAEACSLWLPPVITAPNDAWSFAVPTDEPNFITHKSVVAAVTDHTQRDDLAGRIVAIPSADPGFDWLFSHPIAGLITAYGGANSHMAIRAGELGLPAVIGAGESLFNRWHKAQQLHVDCAARRVEVLR